MPAKNVIVTAADAKFFYLLKVMVASYHKNAFREDTVIRVIDLGLTDEQKSSIAHLVEKFITVEWHLPFPCLKTAPEYRKAFTVTPFLPHYCPDAEVIIWVDADAWLQTPESLNGYIEAAKSGKMVVCQELHPSYPSAVSRGRVKTVTWPIPFLHGRIRSVRTWLRKVLAQRYERDVANRSIFQPVYNAGIFAAQTNSPAWESWAKCYAKARIKKVSHLSDQAPLNYAILTGAVEPYPLPAHYNWICDFAKPVWHPEKQLFVEPLYPHQPLHVIHLLGQSKNRPLTTVDIHGNPAPFNLLGEKV